jgi:hypothetical protein
VVREPALQRAVHKHRRRRRRRRLHCSHSARRFLSQRLDQ